MPDIFGAPLGNGAGASPLLVLLRLAIALLLGCLVAWIYVRTTRISSIGESFPVTLALLAVLIAMVTQVIGDNVARAFSLVGALSIVRFRTVVRDTKDTAYVIFAVVVGMAIGAQNLWVAVIGIGVIGVAAFIAAAAGKAGADSDAQYLLTLRVGLGHNVEQLAGATLDAHLHKRRLVSVSTARQGALLELVYETRLRRTGSAEELVKTLNKIEGMQDVKFERRDFELG
jgi:hypothetical protein